MKNSFKGLSSLIFAGLFFVSCNDNSKTSKSATSDTVATTPAPDIPATTADANQETINYAVPKNASEIIWLQAGIDKGTSKELKDHARMMLRDHKMLEAEVKGLISKKTWVAPTFDTTNVVNITAAAGKDWDKAWTDKMIADHIEILSKFETAKTGVTDEDLRTLVTKTIPVVQSHLNMLKGMQSKMK